LQAQQEVIVSVEERDRVSHGILVGSVLCRAAPDGESVSIRGEQSTRRYCDAKGKMQPVPKSEWDRAPWNRWSFQHVADILPTVAISRGKGPVRELPRNERDDLDILPVVGTVGEAVALAGSLEQTFTDGFLVMRDGAIVYERYLNDMTPQTLHLSQSVAKSFTGMLAGILARRRVIAINAALTDHVPELLGTAYRGATLRHVLDMTSGVRFSEDYTDPCSDMGRADVASGWKPIPDGADQAMQWPQSMVELILSLRDLDREHGETFAYRSIETDVLALVLERATGKRLSQLISEELWQKLGTEQDANMTVDSTGFALADGGLNACLRDYGRFGQMILEEGAGIVPAGWIEATRAGNHQLFGAPYNAVLPDGAYRNQFWIEDSKSRNLMARGVFGQLIYVDFKHRMVVVKLSSWPDFVNPAWTVATLNAVRAIGRALS
jgi:CubicO group peptidase (beta-lactamase class C family)